jgi:hypothetical protein
LEDQVFVYIHSAVDDLGNDNNHKLAHLNRTHHIYTNFSLL